MRRIALLLLLVLVSGCAKRIHLFTWNKNETCLCKDGVVSFWGPDSYFASGNIKAFCSVENGKCVVYRQDIRFNGLNNQWEVYSYKDGKLVGEPKQVEVVQ